MKKITFTAMLVLLGTQALAHTVTRRHCEGIYNRYGHRIGERCYTRTVSHSHRHHHDDSYSSGFADGLLASTLLLTTLDELDDKRDALEMEMAMSLKAFNQNQEFNLSEDLTKLVDLKRASVEDLKEASIKDVLSALLLDIAE